METNLNVCGVLVTIVILFGSIMSTITIVSYVSTDFHLVRVSFSSTLLVIEASS